MIWLEEYWEHSLCEYWDPKCLTIDAVGVLYAGSPPVEVWRGRAHIAEQGDYAPRDLIWLVTSSLSEGVLQVLPSASGGQGQS